MVDNINANQLVHCIYTSAGAVEFTQDDILALLDKCRKNNAELGVTGMLLYEDGSFFQVLEGKPQVVDALLQKIQKDERHSQVTKLIYEEIELRDFGEWTMGYSGVTTQEIASIAGLNDFFRSNRPYLQLDEGRTKKLLKAFKEGQWRATLTS
ncbi:MAG: BLUF domain-containing protein [Halioglobus sp.]